MSRRAISFKSRQISDTKALDSFNECKPALCLCLSYTCKQILSAIVLHLIS